MSKQAAETTLNLLEPGKSGVILQVGNESGAVKRRLIDMGLTPGTRVTVRKIAPFGDPIEVNLRCYELSLRQADAARIILRPDPPGKLRETPEPEAPPLDRETAMRMREDHEHELEVHGSREEDDHDQRVIKLALVGNPNCGKTTLFNALTGSNQYVGNWPGVTVEKKEGTAYLGKKEITVVDLPGIYSLSPYSMEEIVARDFIVQEKPDAIINIVDATNIERNMYLTMQLLELERPVVLALNFMDEVKKHGDSIDVRRLSQELGIPVLPITARTGEGIEELLYVAHQQMHKGLSLEPDDLYDDFTHQIHHRVGEVIHDAAYEAGIPAHWAAIKLIEGDELVEKSLKLGPTARQRVEQIVVEYESSSELGDRETLIADSRYRYIQRVVGDSVRKGRPAGSLSISDRIDSIVTNKYLAVPVFLAMMLVMFAITFGPIGSFLSDGVDQLFNGHFAGAVAAGLEAGGVPLTLRSLVVDGILGGVGGVLTFLPQIALLFFFLSLLEDSGYMARAAFIMDRVLRRFGLSGKAFIPMLMGFGCTVPAVMGARTMENEKDRRMTIMLVPFMSCSARLPVYGLLASAFFARYQGLVVFSLYVVGIIAAIFSGLILKRTVFKGDAAPFVMELPPYRMPTAKNIGLHVWEKVKGFLIRAGTLILIMSVILWFLQSFDISLNMVADGGNSILGAVGNAIAPVLAPLGFGTWQAAVALLTGLVAKEAVVSSMSLFYGFSTLAGSSVIAGVLSSTFTPLSAYAFLIFILLYVPCVASIATIKQEMNSVKWTLASVGWQLIWAYGISFLVFQVGRLLGLG